ncbi:MAG: ferritin [Blastomonas sp. CACIA14H2]|jgi:rubrerythrin|uniref:ferritin-like domain-containing protein n=1 Tax=unclassified Blastomonas TaxID=2626550 RepID=UPI0003CFEE67|nr:ferritin-like domain-containing protein [Blastomonas sp. UPD001]ESZ86959.1 MAG: ferritin [Blastomonas sp. CACIA14H2]MBL0967220.1 ferritin-like domain-containing protein [Blastomonas sp.]
MDQFTPTRRSILGTTGGAMLSAAAIGVLGGVSTSAFAQGKKKSASQGDVDILNVALGLEHEAIAAYSIGAGSGLLAKPVLDAAVIFQGHHKGHRDALIKAITDMGGKPVAAKTDAEYAAALNVAATVKSQNDVLKLAQKLEKGAANAYIGVIPSFSNNDLRQISARLAADEASHWATLSFVLGEAPPAAPLIFG